ncbi:Plasmodium variant antigen protein Cir/Yir/Bir, putative, partial [Plasmodium chabaudi chabaudi]
MFEVCGIIKKIDDCLSKDVSSTGNECSDDVLYTVYCPSTKEGQKGQCETDGGRISAGFIWLLEMFKTLDDVNDFKDINDKYAEYAILWLSSKNKSISSDMHVSVTTIYDILKVKNHTWYNEYRDKIEKKRNAMNFGDYHMGKLYALLNELCNTITKYNENSSFPNEYLNYANKYFDTYKELVTKVSKVKNCDSYCNVLSTLKNAYVDFRDEKNGSDPESQLPVFNVEGMESCEKLCEQKKKESNNKKSMDEKSKDNTPPVLPQQSESQNGNELKKSQNGGSSESNGQNGSKIEQNGSGSTSVGFFDLWSPFRGFILNGTEIYNKAFQLINEHQQSFKNATKKISDVYNSAMDNLKGAYGTSSIYFSEFISNLIGQLNKIDTSPKSSDKLPVSGDSMDGGNARDQLKSTPPEVSEPTTPSTKDTIPDPSSNTITNNENITNVANVKTKETPSIWCIGTNENCDITGIGIIVISISITLAIMYKYLEFGWRKALKRKKNMKKVINSIEGKRQ